MLCLEAENGDVVFKMYDIKTHAFMPDLGIGMSHCWLVKMSPQHDILVTSRVRCSDTTELG